MIILGIHRDPWHNSGAAVIRDDGDGPRYALISEERLDRKKDSRAFPEKSIRACLKELGVKSIQDVDRVVLDYICAPDWKNDYFRTKSVSGTILDEVDPGKFKVINHHMAHACATFYSSRFPEAAILIVDGRGSEKETQSLLVGGPDGIRLVAKTDCIGIGLLYAAVTQAIGFGLLQEGKTMGLAPYGAKTEKPIFSLPRDFKGIVTDYSSVCVEDKYDLKMSHPPLDNFDSKARAALDVQQATEQAMLHLSKFAKESTGKDYLCMSGGVALNSVANYLLLKSGLFRDIYINPGCSDTGIPLGCAMYGYHILERKPQTLRELTPFMGPTYTAEEIRRAVEATPGCDVIRENAMERAADLLAQNKIISFFQGRSEMGPRALGSRSILMSPLKAENKDIINARVKHREPFRPFAPSCLVEDTAEYFEMDRPCPLMLMVPMVRPEKRSVIPAVTHVDGSGRLQTVSREDNPVFYRIIQLFKERTGVPVILNSSFNDNGEPIVESPEDAIRCFLKTQLDAIYIEGYLLIKKPSASAL